MPTRLHIWAAIGLVAACGGTDVASVDGGDFDAGVGPDGSVDAFYLVSCDPVTQAGCEPNEKCAIVPSQVFGEPPQIGCVDGGGSLGMMDSCEPATFNQPDDCTRGMTCVGSEAPHCLPFCSDSPQDTCVEGQLCVLADDLDGDFLVDVMYCAQGCDLLTQDCGGTDIGCYPTRSGELCAPIGAGQTPAGEGELCLHANACEVGLGCFQVGIYGWECVRVCNPSGGAPGCGAGQLCNPVADENWGVCIAM